MIATVTGRGKINVVYKVENFWYLVACLGMFDKILFGMSVDNCFLVENLFAGYFGKHFSF